VFGFDADSLATLVRNAGHAAFLPPDEKVALLGHIEDSLGALRAELDL